MIEICKNSSNRNAMEKRQMTSSKNLVKSQDYKIVKNSLVISCKEKIGKVRLNMNEAKSNDDHTKCVKPTKGDIKINHDADLIDIEGDPLEEFETEQYENLTDHSNCTLAWTDNWEDTTEDNIEMINDLSLSQRRSNILQKTLAWIRNAMYWPLLN